MAAVREGILTKRGQGYPHSWQERVFVLYSDKLDYFNKGGIHKGLFPINFESTVESLDASHSPNQKENCFKVSTEGKDLFMTATSKSERLEWIGDITKEIAGLLALSATELLPQTEENERLVQEEEEAERVAHEKEEANIIESDRQARQVNEEKERLEADAAAKELEQLKLAEAAAETQNIIKTAEAVVPHTILQVVKTEKALEEKKIDLKSLPRTRAHKATAAQKKIDSESNYYERFVWIEHDTGCFHWAKTAAEGPSSKNINIKAHISHCEVGKLSNVDPNFSLVLKEGTNAPGFSKGYYSAKANKIDILIKGKENSALVAEFVGAVNAIVK